jgi:hypothetical protein
LLSSLHGSILSLIMNPPINTEKINKIYIYINFFYSSIVVLVKNHLN